MDLNRCLWGGLLFEVIECVLFFLLVFDLCRFWIVCKRWNELFCKLNFYDFCEFNRKNVYLFVMCYFEYCVFIMVDYNFKEMMSFFDLEVR